MSLKQTISIENFGDKNYQIRLVDDIEHKAIWHTTCIIIKMGKKTVSKGHFEST